MQDRIEKLLRQVIQDLNDLGSPFALVGGLAYGARAEPRFTRDIDFTLAVESEEEAEQITAYLIRCGYYPEMGIANRHTGELATFRMRHKKPIDGVPADQSPYIDLLFSHCGIEKEVVDAATLTEPIPDLPVPTATVPHLIAMKTLSESDRRLQDRIDLQNLIAVATQEDLDAVPPLLNLIDQRGFANGKDLHRVYQEFLDQQEP